MNVLESRRAEGVVDGGQAEFAHEQNNDVAGNTETISQPVMANAEAPVDSSTFITKTETAEATEITVISNKLPHVALPSIRSLLDAPSLNPIASSPKRRMLALYDKSGVEHQSSNLSGMQQPNNGLNVLTQALQLSGNRNQYHERPVAPMRRPSNNSAISPNYRNFSDPYVAQYQAPNMKQGFASNHPAASGFKRYHSQFETENQPALRINTGERQRGHSAEAYQSSSSTYSSPKRRTTRTPDATGTNREFECAHCPQSFGTREALRAHVRGHSLIKPFECDHCDLKFLRRHDLKRHFRSIHSTERPHLCEYCGVSFARADGLRRHLDTELKLRGLLPNQNDQESPSQTGPS